MPCSFQSTFSIQQEDLPISDLHSYVRSFKDDSGGGWEPHVRIILAWSTMSMWPIRLDDETPPAVDGYYHSRKWHDVWRISGFPLFIVLPNIVIEEIGAELSVRLRSPMCNIADQRWGNRATPDGDHVEVLHRHLGRLTLMMRSTGQYRKGPRSTWISNVSSILSFR